MDSIAQTAQSAVNYVSESITGASATASKEANKSQAKDSSQGIGSRVSAAGNAVSDKFDEQSSEAKKGAEKQKM
ncbi:MAG: hypothetical protein CYPHOPRED_005283 [Cyphobasidiales sp. Tagirdzhanova-0007]|nr:MAG: hypothetical protein CYPHOPRED_005283 [Cyphobasidiales sp. Tagirdzhanova-0007]